VAKLALLLAETPALLMVVKVVAGVAVMLVVILAKAAKVVVEVMGL
jgi:hypothetical protein